MASKAPPIPPAQRSSPGDRAQIQNNGARRASGKDQGRSGPQQNTHHSHQQDR